VSGLDKLCRGHDESPIAALSRWCKQIVLGPGSPAVRYWSEDQDQLVERDADPILHGQVSGHTGYSLHELWADLHRFVFRLSISDGEELFGESTP
jgi:hypothetical protein